MRLDQTIRFQQYVDRPDRPIRLQLDLGTLTREMQCKFLAYIPSHAAIPMRATGLVWKIEWDSGVISSGCTLWRHAASLQ